ncbi:MAG: glycosyltransferase family 4 protein [Patescibacteria group bacterium]|nr:glycosyltransferase family 4 protein [Patescibacteria group bacterium]
MIVKKKKILHIIPAFNVGGAERVVWHYARFLDKEKYEIIVASSVEDGCLRPQFESLDINLFVGSRSRQGGRWAVFKSLKKYVEEFKPDLIHSHLFGGDLVAYLLLFFSKRKIKWVSTQHNVEWQTSFLRRFIWKYILRSADKIIAVSDGVGVYCRANFNIKENKIKMIRNGIDLEKCLAVPTECFFQDKALRLAIVGRLEQQKGHIYLFRALSTLKNMDWWRLEIFGDGSLRDKLKIEAKKLGIENRIAWHGNIDDITRFYEWIDVVIQPSLWEGLSLAVMEAMASGRCVVASVPAGEELIKPDETGILVKAGSAVQIADAVRFLFLRKDEGKRMGEKAREYARGNFDIKKNIREIERIYDDLLSKKEYDI